MLVQNGLDRMQMEVLKESLFLIFRIHVEVEILSYLKTYDLYLKPYRMIN